MFWGGGEISPNQRGEGGGLVWLLPHPSLYWNCVNIFVWREGWRGAGGCVRRMDVFIQKYNPPTDTLSTHHSSFFLSPCGWWIKNSVLYISTPNCTVKVCGGGGALTPPRSGGGDGTTELLREAKSPGWRNRGGGGGGPGQGLLPPRSQTATETWPWLDSLSHSLFLFSLSLSICLSMCLHFYVFLSFFWSSARHNLSI